MKDFVFQDLLVLLSVLFVYIELRIHKSDYEDNVGRIEKKIKSLEELIYLQKDEINNIFVLKSSIFPRRSFYDGPDYSRTDGPQC
jgi:hypothetical protein